VEYAEQIDRVVVFFRDAVLVIFDAMYSLAEAASVKEDWGHSSNVVGVELCQLAGARHLCLFHHEPALDDQRIHAIFEETVRFEEITRRDRAVKITAAHDGLELDV
jgi:ribonuclease BN (tRNA processing enzyme)